MIAASLRSVCRLWPLGCLVIVLVLPGCFAQSHVSAPGTPPPARPNTQTGPSLTLNYDFRKGALGWQADVSDYAISQADMQFIAELRPLPVELKTSGTGYYLQGNNRHNYDLFMYLTRRLGPADGIKRNQAYRVTFRLTIASNAGSHCLSVIGAPGESVFLKAGASASMPLGVLKGGRYRLNVDKGEVNMGGKEASLVGNIANGLKCKDFASAFHVPYVSLTRAHTHPVPITANGKGELWLIVGSDSAYESVTGLYYQRINVELAPVRAGAAPVSGSS